MFYMFTGVSELETAALNWKALAIGGVIGVVWFLSGTIVGAWIARTSGEFQMRAMRLHQLEQARRKRKGIE